MPLTPHQKAFLDFITRFQAKQGFAPSQSEIATHFGYRSLGTVQKYLIRLRNQGLLEGVPNARRGLSVRPLEEKSQPKTTETPPFKTAVTLPLLGRVAAGKPIEIIETQDHIDVPSSLIKRGEHFVLEVTGSSMIEDGILHGDHIIVKKQKSAERGQMVVALVNESVTVKRFYPKKGWIELHPANPAFQPILVYPHQSFQIEGIVAGVIRRCH